MDLNFRTTWCQICHNWYLYISHDRQAWILGCHNDLSRPQNDISDMRKQTKLKPGGNLWTRRPTGIIWVVLLCFFVTDVRVRLASLRVKSWFSRFKSLFRAVPINGSLVVKFSVVAKNFCIDCQLKSAFQSISEGTSKKRQTAKQPHFQRKNWFLVKCKCGNMNVWGDTPITRMMILLWLSSNFANEWSYHIPLVCVFPSYNTPLCYMCISIYFILH